MTTDCSWAKIVPTTDGHHVLFFIEHDEEHDDCSTIRCVTRYEGMDATLGFSGIAASKVQEVFDKMDARTADAVRTKVIGGLLDGD